ncbi:Rhombotarget lipoprotein [Candidatus Desulfarcum epimagneticum]|uniref:Rhombotarget lipoprotein n=1 Tax=uncultured Desulfobacteraceae bacterium TaxID=218296 RepID=A0A484HHE3_9BACT|nr:Rhombotarget lipoprotein [uncultured Desulfobacteraceae bacterium]
MPLKSRAVFLMIAVSVLLSSAGCAEIYGTRQTRYASSVVEYLYPGKQIVSVPSIPRLSLPLRVGIAFVPESKTQAGANRLGERDKMELMDRIAKEFKSLPFVKEIQMIPAPYLSSGGGFENLDQIRNMHGIDLIALLSYDQIQHTDEGFLSLAYWTLVGAYIIKGEKNDTSTMMDAAVYDIASRKMLFRAPGLSRVKASSTLINLRERLRADSLKGFQMAADHLTANLKAELARFKNKVKEMPDSYSITREPGYTGGGSLGGGHVLALLLLGGAALWTGRRK